jgi:hypothetical protein
LEFDAFPFELSLSGNRNQRGHQVAQIATLREWGPAEHFQRNGCCLECLFNTGSFSAFRGDQGIEGLVHTRVEIHYRNCLKNDFV